MKINEDYLNQNYEEIWKTTNSNGIPLPYLLKNNIKDNPRELDITSLKLSDKTKEKLNEAYIERRRKETEIYRETKSEKKRRDLINKYMEEELTNWLKKFPQYNDLTINE